MTGAWSVLLKFETESGRSEGRFLVPPDSAWFSGHFPGNPIFPGIASLKLVQEVLAAEAGTQGGRLRIREFSRVKFRGIIRPGDELSVRISPKNAQDPAVKSFSIFRDREVVCDGTVRVQTGEDK